MTVTTTTARNVKNPNGSTTSFPTDFAFEADADLVVTRIVIITGVETLQTLTTDYTVTGGGGAVGSVEMVSPPPGPGLETLVIERSVAFTQSVDYQRNDPFPAEVNETALDKLTFLVQQVFDLIGRSVKLKKSSILDGPVIPDPEVGKVLVGKTTTEFENKTVLDLAATTVTLPLPIADGGTNATTAASARVNLDTQQDLDVPSQAEAEAGTATTERVWTAQRVKQSVVALSDGSLRVIKVITTSGTGNYTKPAGLKRARVRVIGGGGGSGGSAATAGNTASAAGGGGGGGYSEELLEASAIGSTEDVTIGAAGAAGASGANTGGTGGTSSFGSLLSATGGVGGSAIAPTQDRPGASGGEGGGGVGGDINAVGNPGIFSMIFSSTVSGGEGGGSSLGGGAKAQLTSSTTTGNAGSLFGGGASGSGNGFSQSATAGSAGAKGVVIVEEYF